MRLIFIALLAAVGLTSGCATAVRGTTEPVTFVSDPAGAKMQTSTGLTCTTPCTLEIPRSDTFTATFTLNDQTEKVFVDTVISEDAGATTAANVLFTPIIAIPVALAVDATSGANLDHTPNPVKVTFKNIAKVGSDEYEQTAQSPTPAPVTEDSSTSGPTVAAASIIAPEKPSEPGSVRVRITVDVSTGIYSYCGSFSQFLTSWTLEDENGAWQDLKYTELPELNLKARLRKNGDNVIIDAWPHSNEWPQRDVISVSLSSLEPGTSGRTFSRKHVNQQDFKKCGPIVIYANVEDSAG